MFNLLATRHRFKDATLRGRSSLRRRRLAFARTVNVVLLLAILPFGIFGWSMHSLVPGHDHSSCSHSARSHSGNGSALTASSDSNCKHSGHTHPNQTGPNQIGDHHMHRHDGYHVHDAHARNSQVCMSEFAETQEAPNPAIHSLHDCEICKILQQLRSSHFQLRISATGEIGIPLCWIHYQNAELASLDAYYLRGPPIL